MFLPLYGLITVAGLILAFGRPDLAQATNVAFSGNGGVASQSSELPGALGGPAPAPLANDGNTNGVFGTSVSHTDSTDPDPVGDGLFDFWEVALGGGDHPIDQIIVFNRTDCCADRINPFRITLFNDAVGVFSQDVATFTADITGPDIAGMTFDLSGQIGDRVRIQLLHQEYLQLAEVQVFDQLPQQQPVPEPSTYLMFGTGVLGLLGYGWRRRQRVA